MTASTPAGSPGEPDAPSPVQVVGSVARSAALRAAMLDALPAPVCLIGTDGVILATNAPWRRLATTAPGGPLPWGGIGAGYLRVIHTLATSGRELQRPLWRAVDILEAGGGIPRGPVAHLSLGRDPAAGPFTIHLTRIPEDAGGGYLATHLPHPVEGAGTSAPSTAMLQTTLEGLEEGVLLVDPDGVLRVVNQTALRLLARSGWEWRGQSITDLSPRAAGVWKRVREELEREGRDRGVLRFPGPDGVEQPFAWYARSLGGRYLLVLGHPRRSHAGDTPLRQARKLEALGQLTGGIAHEINNILTVILSGVDLVMEEYSPGPGARAELSGVRDAARKGAETVRRLLTFSRRHGDTRRTVDLGEVVRGMKDLLERVLPGNVTLRIQIEDDSPMAVAGPGDVEEMLLNLASNASDSMPGGGILEVRIRRARLGTQDAGELGLPGPGEYLALVVRDTGTGMDATTLERAFEPFYSTKEVDGGTGLGLSLIYGLMREHGGTIVIRSTQGAGTAVTLWFPAAAAPGEPTPIPIPSFGHGGREAILLVEDDAGIRAAAGRILEKAGYRVTSARDGQEAIDVLASEGFQVDLVVSDVAMPRAGGAAVHQASRILPRPPHFLFMSGYAAHDLRGSQSLPVGVPLLPKPWTAVELLRAVRVVLDGGRWDQGRPLPGAPIAPPPPAVDGSEPHRL